MNKYLIILIILATVYYLQYNAIENFSNSEQSIGGIDDQNSINTLAQIAKKLMTGGNTVPGNLNINGDLSITGKITGDLLISNESNDAISKPTTNTRINNKGIQFGGTNNGADTNSAQISAGLHATDSLCIVGMGKTAAARKIDMWAEDKLTLNGNMHITGNTHLNGSLTSKLIYFETDWDDAAFGRECAKYFKRSEPNGTKREFLIKNKSGNHWRYEHALKMGDQVWFYAILNHRMGNNDVHGDVFTHLPGHGDVVRQMIPADK